MKGNIESRGYEVPEIPNANDRKIEGINEDAEKKFDSLMDDPIDDLKLQDPAHKEERLTDVEELPHVGQEELSEEAAKDKFDSLMGDDVYEGVEENHKDGIEDLFKQPEEAVSYNSLKTDVKHTPENNGHWEGEPGNSKWIPDGEYVPKKQNPEEKSWDEIMDENDIDGVNFNDGEPDFSEVSKGTVEIDNFSEDRSDNFDAADKKLAEEKGCTPEEVAKWRKENGYTWHECSDMKTMQKVPSVVHNNIPHSGGISKIKSLNNGG